MGGEQFRQALVRHIEARQRFEQEATVLLQPLIARWAELIRAACQRNGAPHSLSAPVQQGKRQAGEVSRLSGSKQAAGASVPGLDK